ncbi:MAG TPA: hypothetical protein VJM47_04285 [Nitrosospira sp.]|jgi:hypothetical protein|nr:hypothetical protein [Nitrosospira sp.]
MPTHTPRYFLPFKILSIVVIVLIALAIAYAAMISLKNWYGISV